MALPVFALVAGLLLEFAPAPFPRPTPPKTDLEALQGDWEVVECHGQPLADMNGVGDTVMFRNGSVHLGLYSMFKFDVALHAAKSPKRMALLRVTRDFEMPLCTYSLDGDRLVIRYMPKVPSAPPWTGRSILVLKRVPAR